jgi:hypothetical protein
MQEADVKPKTQEKEIGNTRFTQAMGEAGNIGIAATVVSTLVIGALLYFGKEKVDWIKTGISKIEGGFDWIKKKMGNGSGNGSQKMTDILASLTAASGIGYLIGHLAMIPAYREGWRKADAEKKLLNERGDLVTLLKAEVEEKNQEIGNLHMQLKRQSSPDEMESGEEPEKRFASDHLKKSQHHSRGASHSSSIENEQPAELAL